MLEKPFTAEFYVVRRGELLELRQTRFLSYFNHPHDVCAVARTVDEMKAMLKQVNWSGSVDYSRVEGETNGME